MPQTNEIIRLRLRLTVCWVEVLRKFPYLFANRQPLGPSVRWSAHAPVPWPRLYLDIGSSSRLIAAITLHHVLQRLYIYVIFLQSPAFGHLYITVFKRYISVIFV